MGNIKIKIDATGGIEMETEGFLGTACKDATDAMEKALVGEGTTTVSSDKPEMYDTGDGQLQEHTW